MKLNSKFLLLFLIIQSFWGFAQSTETVKVGKAFNFTYPKTYFKTFDLNSDSSLQISNNVQGKHTIIIQDDKVSLSHYKVVFENLEEAADFYSNNLFEALTGEKKKHPFVHNTINGNKSVELKIEGDFVDEELGEKNPISYLLTIVETKGYYYQILSWTTTSNMVKNLEEFRTMAKSFKEID